MFIIYFSNVLNKNNIYNPEHVLYDIIKFFVIAYVRFIVWKLYNIILNLSRILTRCIWLNYSCSTARFTKDLENGPFKYTKIFNCIMSDKIFTHYLSKYL